MAKVFNRDVKIRKEGSDLSVYDVAKVVAAIPTTDQNDSETIWNDNGVLKVSSAA